MRTTDPMVILREKGRVTSSYNILNRSDTYGTIRTHTVVPLQKIKTIERDLKCQRILNMTKTPGKYDDIMNNPDSL